ncbi:hypothetical protein LCGC14_0932240 [marine sediment metagenome]|uniref:ribonucleoside-diphosphate reductase n=1 Tax=marine sediment metagenome TaxID=412755 RepID=A0A0F9RU37_9ZZZZ
MAEKKSTAETPLKPAYKVPITRDEILSFRARTREDSADNLSDTATVAQRELDVLCNGALDLLDANEKLREQISVKAAKTIGVVQRERLPPERDSITKKFYVGPGEDGEGYLIVGMYPDGRVGEIFVSMDKQGSTVSGFIDCWSIAVSMLLQLGVPLKTIVQKFRGMQFKPAGITQDEFIAKSPVDYVCCWLAKRFPEQTGDE